jgi:Spy/CpxP family protein refolding chaperone
MFKPLAITVTLGALLLASLAAPVSAQPPRGGGAARPWWDAEVAKNANLSDVQQKQLTQIQHDFRPRMKEVQENVRKADAEVSAAFNEEPVDETKATAAIEKLATARAEMTRAVSQLDLKLRKVLTAEQWQELNRHQRNWPQDRPGPRRRGPAPNSTATTTQQK